MDDTKNIERFSLAKTSLFMLTIPFGRGSRRKAGEVLGWRRLTNLTPSAEWFFSMLVSASKIWPENFIRLFRGQTMPLIDQYLDVLSLAILIFMHCIRERLLSATIRIPPGIVILSTALTLT
jgi:hypothetical protein